MKTFKIYILFLMLLCIGCGKDQAITENIPRQDFTPPLDGLCIRIDESHVIDYLHIDYYDFSTHILYLKENDEFLKESNLELGYAPFVVYADKEEIYRGQLWPGWSNSMPAGAYINYPDFYPEYIIRINYRAAMDSLHNLIVDLRSDQRIISVLKKFNQYHEGLTFSMDTFKILPGNKIFVQITLSNPDTFDYYILSPDKMGLALFHYFSNGLVLYNDQGGYFKHKITVAPPDPWNSWSRDWLDRLNRGEEKSYSITYEAFDSIPSGNYKATFVFPGLHQVGLADIQFGGGRIWLGDLESSMEVKVD